MPFTGPTKNGRSSASSPGTSANVPPVTSATAMPHASPATPAADTPSGTRTFAGRPLRTSQ